MKNVTKLACWPKLKEMGFTPVRYSAHGRLSCIGAALMTKQGADIIEIEPSGSDYHVSGHYIKAKELRFEDGTPSFTYFCNVFVGARELLQTVDLLKKEPYQY